MTVCGKNFTFLFKVYIKTKKYEKKMFQRSTFFLSNGNTFYNLLSISLDHPLDQAQLTQEQ